MKKRFIVFLIMAALIVTTCDKPVDAKAFKTTQTESKSSNSLPKKLLKRYNKQIDKLTAYQYNKIPQIQPKTTTENLNQITFSAEYEPKGHVLSVCENVDYYNATKEDLNKLYFNMYGNDKVYRKKGGSVKLSKVQVNGTDVNYQFYKKSDTIVEVDLPMTLAKENRATVTMEYKVTVPKKNDRFGYNANINNFGNAIILPVVYDERGFVLHEFVNMGDPFYTDMANFDATITVPKGYRVAATGEQVQKKNMDGKVKYQYTVQKVRDYAFCISDQFKTCSVQYGDVKTTVYYTNKSKLTAKYMLAVAGRSLKEFGKIYGRYPYKTLDVVEVSMENFGGMEYPCLVMISVSSTLDKEGTITGDGKEEYGIETCTMHEIGHQWLYQIVGNDEVEDSWIDEGMNTYGESLYYGRTNREYWTIDQNKDFIKDIKMVMKNNKQYRINNSLNDYGSNSQAYYYMSYYAGALLMKDIRDDMGDKEYMKVLKAYINEFAYDEVTTEEFKTFWNEHTKKDLSKIYAKYMR